MLALGISNFKMGLYVILNHQGLNPSEYLTEVWGASVKETGNANHFFFFYRKFVIYMHYGRFYIN